MNMQQTLPARIDIAFCALAYTHSIQIGGTIETPHGPQTVQPRTLTQAEMGMRNTAAEVIRNFIAGEIDPSALMTWDQAPLQDGRASNARRPKPNDPSPTEDVDGAEDIPW